MTDSIETNDSSNPADAVDAASTSAPTTPAAPVVAGAAGATADAGAPTDEPPGPSLVAAEVDNCIMSKEAAPCWAIIAIVLLAIAGIIASLWYVSDHWKSATGPSSGSVADLQVDLDLAKDEFKAARARLDAEPTGAAVKPAVAAATSDPNTNAEQKAATDPAAIEKLRNDVRTARAHVQEAERKLGPDPSAVLTMVAVLGALGGLIHLVTSIVTYIGNRQLIRSWVLYYVTAPFLGAALAPVVYLLFSNSVVQSVSGSGVNTQNLNLPGLYAIATLTGMFARQATEKLADIFSMVFSKVDAGDKLKQTQ